LSRYLYDKEQYGYAREFTETALTAFTNKETLAYASAIDLLGLIELDMNRPQKALAFFETGLSIRQNLLPQNDPLLAFAFNNLALAYTEIPDLSTAEAFHQKAISLRLQNSSDRIGNSYSNYAVTLLRMNQADRAESSLMQCPSLRKCTDDAFLQADNPRFVGDMVLLSRIRHAQGRRDEALRLASKALTWRKKVHGDRFKTCDSMFDVACLLHEEGQSMAALDLLTSLQKMAVCLDSGEGHGARAEWKTGKILEGMGRGDQSEEHKKKALALRKVFRPEEGDVVDNDESWIRLAPYMLW
jgi:tetratricopeptide (TPR) repeat protein